MKPLCCVALLVLASVVVATAAETSAPPAVVWKLDRADRIGGFAAEVLGAPAVSKPPPHPALSFDGVDDAVQVPANPIAGWERFTVEILLNPAAEGPEAQRFLHIGDGEESRLLIELRLTRDARWCVDTFLRSHDSSLTLIDRTLLHPAETWTWVALRYDGRTMSHYVNGAKECEGEIAFAPMKGGRTSIGVRLNRVFWFKGRIAEIRFHPTALVPSAMARAR